MSVRLVAESVFGNPGNRGQWGQKSLAALAWQVRKRMSGRPREMRLPNDVCFNAYPDCVASSALVYADWPEYHELMQVRGHSFGRGTSYLTLVLTWAMCRYW